MIIVILQKNQKNLVNPFVRNCKSIFNNSKICLCCKNKSTENGPRAIFKQKVIYITKQTFDRYSGCNATKNISTPIKELQIIDSKNYNIEMDIENKNEISFAKVEGQVYLNILKEQKEEFNSYIKDNNPKKVFKVINKIPITHSSLSMLDHKLNRHGKW